MHTLTEHSDVSGSRTQASMQKTPNNVQHKHIKAGKYILNLSYIHQADEYSDGQTDVKRKWRAN